MLVLVKVEEITVIITFNHAMLLATYIRFFPYYLFMCALYKLIAVYANLKDSNCKLFSSSKWHSLDSRILATTKPQKCWFLQPLFNSYGALIYPVSLNTLLYVHTFPWSMIRLMKKISWIWAQLSFQSHQDHVFGITICTVANVP